MAKAWRTRWSDSPPERSSVASSEGPRDHAELLRAVAVLSPVENEMDSANGPSEWQKSYEEQARHSRRIAPVVEAAE